jgi:hypothetical protein
MVDNREVLFMTLMICCYCLLVSSCNMLLVVFQLLVKYLVYPTNNPTSPDSAAQRIDDYFCKGGIISLRNVVKILLFQVARKYATFRGPNSMEKTHGNLRPPFIREKKTPEIWHFRWKKISAAILAHGWESRSRRVLGYVSQTA